MLIQVDYMDQNGSICYFCGEPLNIDSVVEKEYSHATKRVTSKVYQCKCAQGHFSFVQIHQKVNAAFEINIRSHMFVFFDDYIEHGGGNESEEVVFRCARNCPLTEKRKLYYGKNQTKQVHTWVKGQSKKVHRQTPKGGRGT